MAGYLSDDIRLRVSKGHVKQASVVHKFGASPEISTAQTATIWDVPDAEYPWDAFTSASTVTVDAADVSDVGSVITVVGLDANYNEIQEDITLAVQTGNAGSVSFKRVFRAFVASGTGTNVGNVDVKVATDIVARIRAGKGQTLMSVYTVPAGKTAYIYKSATTVQANADVTLQMMQRPDGGVFRIAHQAEVSPNGYEYEFSFPMKLPEKTDIDVRARANTNNVRCTAVFDLLLIEE